MTTTLENRPIAIAMDDMGFARHALYRMAFIRAFEQRCQDFSMQTPPAFAGSSHLCAGQEAIPVGAIGALGPSDRVVATYRGHGWALERCPDPLAVLAEICQREGGLNGGRGGSAYMMAPEHGFIGENSIVGAGTPIACGVAMAAVAKKTDGVVVVSIGDGAMNQGAVHEAFVMAAYQNLPVIFMCENNGWSEMTPITHIVKLDRLARRAGGYGMQSATIDGCDPIAVRDSVALAAKRARAGDGPTLLECRTIRLWGHYNRDIEHYRPKADRAEAEARDPVRVMVERLLAAGDSNPEIEGIQKKAAADVDRLGEAVLKMPEPNPASAALHVTAPIPARRAAAQAKTEARNLTYIQAVTEALRAELSSRPETLLFGEDVGQAGGIFGASRNLQREFGAGRVFDTPIAESSILGSAVGAAMMGMRPIVEIMFADFLFVAFDQIINQAANVRYVSQGKCSAPLVVRMQQGATPGSCAQHSQSIEAFLAHIPGIRVGLPATPQDAYAMLRAAAAQPDPCVIIESRSLYQTSGPVHLVDEAEPIGGAVLRRPGSDAAIVCWGTMVPAALSAAETLTNEGRQIAVLDLRWLAPLDEAALSDVVKQCGGRIVIAHEANLTGGFGAEISALLIEKHPALLKTPPRRVGAPNIRMPSSPVLQSALLPEAGTIADAVRQIMPG